MITDLRIQNLRSYTDSSLELSFGVNIVVGPNASGKTSLLESVLLIALGKSYRSRDIDLISFDKAWLRVDADLPNAKRTVKIQKNGDDKVVKTIDLDGKTTTRMSLHNALPLVLFEPQQLLLLSGSPEVRREFLDDLLEQTTPGFGAARRQYKRVLAQRNYLLKKKPQQLTEQVFVWNVRLSELAGRIVRERSALVDNLAQKISGLYSSLSDKNQLVYIKYDSQFDSQQYESAMLSRLDESLEQDSLRGFTSCGPHRDDLSIYIDGHPVQGSASRGELRTIVLALKIIELDILQEIRGTPPLVLLDDVFSELDGKRRQALTKFLKNYQTFITTTDADMVVGHFSDSNIIPVASGPI